MKKYFLLVVTLALFICVCSNKTPISEDVFKKAMMDAGYTLHDVRKQYNANTAKSVTVALNKDSRIEFFVLASEECSDGIFFKYRSS